MSAVWIAAFLALAVLQVVTLVVVVGVLRQVLPLLETADPGGHGHHPHGDGLPVTPRVGPVAGTPLPSLTARTGDGREVTAADLSDGAVVLLFVDDGCEPCRQLTAELRQGPLRLGTTRLYPVIDDGDDPTHVAFGPGVTVLRHGGAVADALGVDSLPSAVVARDGVVLEGRVVSSASHLQGLIDWAEALRPGALQT